MKVQATVVLSFQARTLNDAGSVLDEVLARAQERDVDVAGVELVTPPGDRLVTLPPLAASSGAAPRAPVTQQGADGS